MQFPVPQFTEVEDKIFGPLTLKQFGIVFGAGVVIFLGYSATKSLAVLVVLFLLFGLPALGIAFAKPNGRPLYNSFGFMFRFYTSPKELIFHREARSAGAMPKNQNPDQAPASVDANLGTTQDRLREVNQLLQKNAQEEKDILKM